jgi:hypothetical protein
MIRATFARWRRLALAAALLTLGGCASSGVDVSPGLNGRYGEASRLMLLAATSGPIPLDIDLAPAGTTPSSLAAEANRSIAWSNAVLSPGAPPADDDFKVAFRFASVPSDPQAVCAGRDRPGAAQAPGPGLRLHAIACNGSEPVADLLARSERSTPEAATQLARETTARLFPGGDMGGRWGTGWGIPGVRVGVGVGSGGRSGVGVGVGF